MPNHYTTIAICSPGHDFNCDKFNEEFGKENLCQIVKPMPDEIAATPCVMYSDGTTEAQRSGKPTDCIAWANENWGTKWGTYNNKAFALDGNSCPVVIKFQSAWSAPNPNVLELIGSWLKKLGNFEDVRFLGFDPYDDSLKFQETNKEAV